MRIWNPSHFTIGKVGRSNCPRWRGQDYKFKENEVKEVPDLCGRHLITAFGYYGLVSLPDRNIVTDNDQFDKAVEKLREHGVQQLYKWSVRVIDQYREEAKKCVDARERPPRPNEFVKTASKIHKKYHEEIMLSDPETIEEHNLMREILGTVEHDSDKLLDQTLTKEIADADKNSRQYSKDLAPVKDVVPNTPGEPEPKVDAKERATIKNVPNKRKRKVAPTSAPSVQPSTMDNMKTDLDLDNSAMG